MKRMVIDLNRCIGCHDCQLACKDEYVDNDWGYYAAPQGENQFWIKVNETERGVFPKAKVEWKPILCLHCQDAPCVKVCPEKAITVRDDGIVLIDPFKCRGHGECIKACPYGVIYFNRERKIAQKCTMCAHLLDRGWKEPRCVTACPAEALKFGEEEELFDLWEMGTDLNFQPEPVTKVRYVGLEKKFIAGEVYSPVEDICLEEVEVIAVNRKNGCTVTAVTNNFGDFWLKNLEEGIYDITLSKDGYYSKTFSNLSTSKSDLNLGEIKLYKKAK